MVGVVPGFFPLCIIYFQIWLFLKAWILPGPPTELLLLLLRAKFGNDIAKGPYDELLLRWAKH
jgi:hypothetical protein